MNHEATLERREKKANEQRIEIIKVLARAGNSKNKNNIIVKNNTSV
jgi:hypothetical protein